jgi:hypothetical protein
LFLGGVGLLGCRIVRNLQQLFRPTPPMAVRARRKQTKAGR